MNLPAATRMDRLDALRGFAVVWMALFHLAFDLNHFGLLDTRYNFHRDALWTTQRTCIVSLFLLCAGLGQALALQGQSGVRYTPGFWRRWMQIAACAALVSLGGRSAPCASRCRGWCSTASSTNLSVTGWAS